VRHMATRLFGGRERLALLDHVGARDPHLHLGARMGRFRRHPSNSPSRA
jgi:hypothetical protein